MDVDHFEAIVERRVLNLHAIETRGLNNSEILGGGYSPAVYHMGATLFINFFRLVSRDKRGCSIAPGQLVYTFFVAFRKYCDARSVYFFCVDSNYRLGMSQGKCTVFLPCDFH